MGDISDLYPKAQNPIDTISGFARLQNVINQNKLFQQQYNTNLGLSDIYKNAIDPSTGQLDASKLPGLIQSNPNVTYGLPEAFRQSQEAQQRNMAIQQGQLDLARKKFEAVSGYLAPLAALGPKATSSDVVSALAHAGTVGVATPEEQARIYATLPRIPGQNGQLGQIDESQIPNWIRSQQITVQENQARLDALYPKPDMTQLPGGGMAPITTPRFGQPQQVGPTIQAAPPPTTTVVGPDQTPRYIGAPQGNNPYEAEYQRNNGGGSPAPGNNIAGQAAGLSPAQQTASSGQGQASIQMASALQGRADQVPTNKGLLQNLNATLSDFTPGPGAKWSKEALAATNRVAQTMGLKGVGTDSVKAQEEFDKMATQLAQSQFQQLGGTGANFQLESTISTSPNSALSKLGNKGIISLLQGNEDAIAAKNKAWQAYQQKNGPQSYGAFSTEFNQHFDPRVFQFQYLNRDDQKKMISGMSQAQKNKLHDDALYAKQQGWVGGGQ